MKRYLSLLLLLISLFSFGCQKAPEKVEEIPEKVQVVEEVKEEPKSAKNELTPEERLASVSLDMFPLFQNTGYTIEIVTDSISNYGYSDVDNARGICDHENKKILILYTIIDDYGNFFETTIYHEMAHAIDYVNNISSSIEFNNCYSESEALFLKSNLNYSSESISNYTNNIKEYFAESYALYKMKNEVVKENAPLTYAFFENNMK